MLCLLAGSSPGHAHEAWIEPSRYTLAPGEILSAHLRVGQMFRGNSLLYNPDKFQQLQVVTNGRTEDVRGRLGDLPAIRHELSGNGLHTVVYVSTGNRIGYETEEKFIRFARNEGLEWILDEHRRRGFPDRGFYETYYRHAKSLVVVGHAPEADRPLGLKMEIVLLDRPFAADRSEVRAQVLWQGQPYPDAQITIFHKAPEGGAARHTVRTDADGIGRIPLVPGERYLLNAVYAEPVDDAGRSGPLWITHWASITFQSGG